MDDNNNSATRSDMQCSASARVASAELVHALDSIVKLIVIVIYEKSIEGT